MENIRTNVFEENQRLKEQLAYKTKQANDWQEKYYELVNELKKTQALLRQFLNENTPSSKLPFKAAPHKDSKESKPNGKPLGSPGATKDAPEKTDRKVKAKLSKSCPRCGKVIAKSEIVKRIRYVYDIIIKPEIIEVEEETSFCDCGEFCIGTHPDIPQRGMFGYNLQALCTELKHNFSGSYKNISKFLKSVAQLKFSDVAIHNCLKGITEKLEPSYDEIESKLKDEDYAYSDETGWPVNGIRWWLWLFVTANFVFLTINHSRGRRVLLDIFGEDYHGGIISDCLKVYREFARWFQKCWVHLLRKVKHEMEKHPDTNLVKLYEQLKNLHKKMTEFLQEDPPPELRKKKKKEYEKKLNKIINYNGWCVEAQAIVDNWLKGYRDHWLTAIEIPGISLDNNLCERKIRGSISWRKMLGGHKTREGAKRYAIIETHRQTWRFQGKSPFNELRDFLQEGKMNIIEEA